MGKGDPVKIQRAKARRGSVYLVVLATMSVGLLAVSAGLLVTRIHAGRSAALAESAQATRNAQSGVQAALRAIELNAAWRSAASNPFLSMSKGDDKFTVALSDPGDANLSDSAEETVLIRAEGISGGARRMYSVRATPALTPHPCLSYALVADKAVTFGSSHWWTALPIHSNTSFSATSSTITASATSVGTVSAGFTPAGVGGQAAVALPTMASVVAAYTAIGSSGLLGGTGPQTIGQVVIGPNTPPSGLSANALGVYVIDCGGKRLTIQNARVRGTLILINNAAGVRLTSNVMIDPATAGYPALITDGDLTITISGSDLSEAAQNVNFNPVGEAFEGSADSDKTDVYACEIRGLIYAAGNVTMSGGVSMTAPVLTGGTVTTTSHTMIHRGVAPTTVPPGFTIGGGLVVDRSTWRREMD
jgi:hypothetical protein